MYRFPIRFGDDPEVLAKFWNEPPAANASIDLYLCADRIVEHVLDPFLFEIGTTSHDAGREVVRFFHWLSYEPAIA